MTKTTTKSKLIKYFVSYDDTRLKALHNFVYADGRVDIKSESRFKYEDRKARAKAYIKEHFTNDINDNNESTTEGVEDGGEAQFFTEQEPVVKYTGYIHTF